MKKIPRIVGTWWPVCLILAMFLFLLPAAFAQDTGTGTGDKTVSGGAAGDTEAVDVSAAEGEASDILAVSASTVNTEDEPVQLELQEISVVTPEPVYVWNFQKPQSYNVKDRISDEGGAFALTWLPSSTDEQMTQVVNPDTGETTESPAYEYWVFQSQTGEPGTWGQSDQFAANSQYTWEAPQYFGFFLSANNHGNNSHYSIYEILYPATGIYEYSIDMMRIPNPEKPEEMIVDPARTNEVVITAKVFDLSLTDYSSIQVYCDLRPFGGQKVALTYQPPEPGSEPAPWDNIFTGTGTVLPEKVSITKPYWILLTAPVHGKAKSVIEIQPTLDKLTNITMIVGSGNVSPVPDNRYDHFFRLYAVPAGYVLPEGSDLPPDEWMIGNQTGPVKARSNWWNTARTNSALWSVLICCAVMFYILHARRGASLFLRRIAGLDHVEEAIGRATEMGRPILYTCGLGYVSDIATIASINILGQVARKVADYESRLIVPSRDPIIMAVCEEVIQEAYIDAGRPNSYNKDDVFFLTDDQFAYTAAVNGIMVREKPATIMMMGLFYAESLLLAETGASTGAIQIAGTDALAQLPFFITACDYTLIGEELYAASAYLSREPLLVGSLKGQDLAKMIFMILTFVGTLFIFFKLEFIQQLFQAF
ncbi:MAG: hypothetical protein NTY09_03135 [bacterium]|nr:hypothetical protein [bacterium]